MSLSAKNLVILSVLTTLCSCGEFGASTPCSTTSIFLPGECLASNELEYNIPASDGQQVISNRFLFSFSLDLSGHKVERTDDYQLALHWRDVPSDELFSKFGDNQNAVREEFERLYENFYHSFLSRFHKSDFSLVTILYNGGLTLRANKDFAGYPAGDNLEPLVTCWPSWDSFVEDSREDPVIGPGCNTPGNAAGFLGIPLEYKCMIDDGISFSIPMGEYELVKEPISFELVVPVKVVYYLQWINDRITNPAAPVPYLETEFHCNFTSEYGLSD